MSARISPVWIWLVVLAAALPIFPILAQTRGQSPTAESATGLDQAVALLNEARLHFQTVRDYECRLIKRERVKGMLLPQSVFAMKVRNKPFSVYMRCDSPEDDKGIEDC